MKICTRYTLPTLYILHARKTGGAKSRSEIHVKTHWPKNQLKSEVLAIRSAQYNLQIINIIL